MMGCAVYLVLVRLIGWGTAMIRVVPRSGTERFHPRDSALNPSAFAQPVFGRDDGEKLNLCE